MFRVLKLRKMKMVALDVIQHTTELSQAPIEIITDTSSEIYHNETKEMIPYRALNSYTVYSRDGICIYREFEECGKIQLSLNMVYQIAKCNQRDPIQFLYEVLEYLRFQFERRQDPVWRKVHSVINRSQNVIHRVII